MIQVELVYERSCPNIEAARRVLLEAFTHAGVALAWREWEVGEADTPPRVRSYGSPTILVDGRDVVNAESRAGPDCCRVYQGDDGRLRGVPPLADIVTALRAATTPAGGNPPGKRWWKSASLLPAIGVVLLPKLICPACWPAYAALTATLGIGFFDYTPYLLPLTTLFLGVVLLILGYRASQRRGWGPLLLGTVAAALVLSAKFHFDNHAWMVVGLLLLVAAYLWNSWPVAGTSPRCDACGTGDTGINRPSKDRAV